MSLEMSQSGFLDPSLPDNRSVCMKRHLCATQEALNAFIEEAVLNSKALASTKADSKGRQGDVYNSVRKEIEYILTPWLAAFPSQQ